MKLLLKKSVMNQVISVFILVLVISVIAGMTFLFTAQLKTQIASAISSDKSTYMNSTAWVAVNSTEAAGATVISYLPLLFLALIFGVILIVTLRVILPYINLGSQMGGTI